MGHSGINGTPLYPLDKGHVYLVDGTVGNTIPVSNERIKRGESFFLLFAAQPGQNAQIVAEAVRDHYKLQVRPYQNTTSTPSAPSAGDQVVNLDVHPQQSYSYRDPHVRDKLWFRPSLSHLAPLFGDSADYYLVACSFNSKDQQNIFSEEERAIKDPQGVKTGDFLQTKKFDLLFYTNQNSGIPPPDEVMILGQLAIYDRANPKGNPVDFKIARLSDNHVAYQHDEMGQKILKQKNLTPYLQFNNPNDVTESEIEVLNTLYDQGKVHWVIFQGDNIDENSRSFDNVKSLKDSNNALFATMLKKLKPPVIAMLGNHEDLGPPPPASLMSENYQLPADYLQGLQSDRYYNLPDFFGYARWVYDGQQALFSDPQARRPFHHVINRYEDMKLVLEGQSPVTILLMTTGGNDVAHFRQDDPIYRDELQGLWPWQGPYIHPKTIVQFYQGRSPDVEGFSAAQLSWLANQNPHYVFAHAPFLNHTDLEPFDPQATEIKSLRLAGEFEDNNFGAMVHNSRMLLRLLVDNPNFRGFSAGHSHRAGNGYAFGVDSEDQIKLFRGPVIEALNLTPKDVDSIYHFWNPKDPCVSTCPLVVNQLYSGATIMINQPKLSWQLGSAGTGINPSFVIDTISPEGLITGEKAFFPAKKIREISPGVYEIVYDVGSQPMGSNQRLVREWEEIKQKNPLARFMYQKEKKRLENRLNSTSLDFLAQTSEKIYPELDTSIKNPVGSITKLSDHLKLNFFTRMNPSISGNDFNLGIDQFGLSLDLSLSEAVVGQVVRAYLLEGATLGIYSDHSHLHGYLALRAPHVFDWQMNREWVLRGLSLTAGIGVDGGKPNFHRQLKVAEVGWQPSKHLELSGALVMDDLFGDNRIFWSIGVDLPFHF